MMVRTTQSFAFLGDMVAQVRTGRLAPAAFQRQYVWSRNDIEEMWASIASHDPLGGLLLWQPEDAETTVRMARSHLGPVEMLTGPRSALILDGQNRLVTLAWSMYDPDTVSDDAPGATVWKGDDQILVADPVTEPGRPVIRFMPRCDVRGMMMPVWTLFDNHAFNDHVRRNWNGLDVAGEIAVEWLSLLQEAVRQARVVVSTIEGGNVEQAKRRFLRIARVGVPMSAADFDEISTLT